MSGEIEFFLSVHELATTHTLAVIQATPDELWDKAWSGVKTLREQLLHITLVRESICHQLAGKPTTGLNQWFDEATWHGGTAELTLAFAEHAGRCRGLLALLDSASLDSPFTTPFGNRSTASNYLRTMLLEEHHHRAQMTQLLRLAGMEPPPYPGQAWVELGVEQDGAQPPR